MQTLGWVDPVTGAEHGGDGVDWRDKQELVLKTAENTLN